MSLLRKGLIDNSSMLSRMQDRADLDDLRSKFIIHPSTLSLKEVRCPICNFRLGFVDGLVQIKCHKCKYVYLFDSRVAPTTDML